MINSFKRRKSHCELYLNLQTSCETNILSNVEFKYQESQKYIFSNISIENKANP